MFFKKYFERKKFRVIAFSEPVTEWKDNSFSQFSIVFYENDIGERKWEVSGGDVLRVFENTTEYIKCETWRRTGLLPDWVKDPMVEKLSR